jgi:hypothetical protein
MNIALAFGILYIHAHEQLGNVLPDLEKTLFSMDKRERATIEILKVENFFLTNFKGSC